MGQLFDQLLDGQPALCVFAAPSSAEAADAVMRAYRDGKTRQTVRLRLDELFDMESLPLGRDFFHSTSRPGSHGVQRMLNGGSFGDQHDHGFFGAQN